MLFSSSLDRYLSLGLKISVLVMVECSLLPLFSVFSIKFNDSPDSEYHFFCQSSLNADLASTNGQLNSECIYEVTVSPKMPTKDYQDFCPTL